MKCTGHIKDITRDYKTSKFVLTVEINENVETSIDELKDCENLDLSLVKHRKKRSLDANAYFWVLVGKLAQKTQGKEKEDIYREYIRQSGCFDIVPVRADLIEHWNRVWSSKGAGWVTEDIGECKNFKDYHNIKCYYGTSLYDSEQMAHLIDMVVQDCKAVGIETATPEEIERMKSLWKM